MAIHGGIPRTVEKMLETARNLVVKEIAVARSRSEESTQAEIEQIFEKN